MRLFMKERKVYVLHIKVIWLLICIFVGICLCQFIYNTCYSPVINEKAKMRANEIAQKAVYNAVQSQLKITDISPEKVTNIKYKDDGSISSVSLNTAVLNSFKSAITEKIIRELAKYKSEVIKVSPLAFYGYSAFGWMPKVNVIVVPSEILSCDFNNSFVSQGINQTKHSIYISAEIKIKLLLPIGSEEFTVKNTTPVAETIIVGSVPETYTNVEGVQESEADTILNLAP